MKRLLVLATVIVLAVAAVGAVSTGAWFTSSAQIQNVSLDAGSLVIVVTEPVPLDAANLEPGGPSQLLGVYEVTNNGTADMKFRAWFGEPIDPAGLASYLTATVTMNPSSFGGTVGPVDLVVCTNVPFTTLMTPGNACLTEDTVAVAFGDTVAYQIDVALGQTAPNSVQNATLVVNLDLYATQFINPGW